MIIFDVGVHAWQVSDQKIYHRGFYFLENRKVIQVLLSFLLDTWTGLRGEVYVCFSFRTAAFSNMKPGSEFHPTGSQQIFLFEKFQLAASHETPTDKADGAELHKNATIRIININYDYWRMSSLHQHLLFYDTVVCV